MFTDVRICVIQDGLIINEVLFNKGQNINIGTSLNNSIVLSGSGISDSLDLLIFKEGIYYLKIYEGLIGKIIENNKILSFEELIKNADSYKEANSILVPLSQNARGSLAFANNTVLFRMNQSISVPHPVPKEFKTSILTDFDFSFLLISFFMFLSYIILASSFSKFKPKEAVKFDDVPERFARLILDKPIIIKQEKEKPLPTPELIKQDNTQDRKEKKVKEKVSEEAKKVAKDPNLERNVPGTKRKGGGAEPSKQEVAEMVRTSGIIGIIGSKSKQGGGSVANLFSEQGFGKKLDEALKGVAGLNTGQSLDEAKMRRGSGSAKAINIGDLKTTTGSGAVGFGDTNVSAVNVLGDGSDSEQSGEGSINPGVIAKTLARHVGAFQYCYNRALRSTPTLAGELIIIFAILENGDVSNNEINFTGPAAKSSDLTSCVRRVFVRIKFPEPKGGSVTVRYPLNFTAQN